MEIRSKVITVAAEHCRQAEHSLQQAAGFFKRSILHIFRMGTIGFLLVLAGVGCISLSKSILTTSIHNDEGFLVHPVKWEGETLSIVARWYTGNLENWKVIARVNPAIDPNKIVIGNAIRIPSGLLITRKPLPQNFLAGFNAGRPADEMLTRPESTGLKRAPGPAPPERGRPVETQNRSRPPAAPPPAEPVIGSVPAERNTKPVLPQTGSPPSASPLQPEKRSGGPTLPAASSSAAPKSDQKLAAPKSGPPAEKEEEPPLFGPKGYHN